MADFIWTDTITSRLIDLREGNEIIWNIRSKEYKNRAVTNLATTHVCIWCLISVAKLQCIKCTKQMQHNLPLSPLLQLVISRKMFDSRVKFLLCVYTSSLSLFLGQFVLFVQEKMIVFTALSGGKDGRANT